MLVCTTSTDVAHFFSILRNWLQVVLLRAIYWKSIRDWAMSRLTTRICIHGFATKFYIHMKRNILCKRSLKSAQTWERSWFQLRLINSKISNQSQNCLSKNLLMKQSRISEFQRANTFLGSSPASFAKINYFVGRRGWFVAMSSARLGYWRKNMLWQWAINQI